MIAAGGAASCKQKDRNEDQQDKGAGRMEIWHLFAPCNMIKNVLINSIADSREKKIPIRKKLEKNADNMGRNNKKKYRIMPEGY